MGYSALEKMKDQASSFDSVDQGHLIHHEGHLSMGFHRAVGCAGFDDPSVVRCVFR